MKKISILVTSILAAFTSTCFSFAYTENLICELPTHPSPGPWLHSSKWITVTDAPNSKLSTIGGNTKVIREYTAWPFKPEFTCTFLLEDGAKVVLKSPVSEGENLTHKDINGSKALHFGKWSSDCTTTANNLGFCWIMTGDVIGWSIC